MAKLYGIGAAVVIVGALFKIQHWPAADLFLILGLSTEAIIFFFSAFEPPHEDPDWSLVYRNSPPASVPKGMISKRRTSDRSPSNSMICWKAPRSNPSSSPAWAMACAA
ncbi:MAG: gliding motility protein GldL [Flavobacteriales bacterium]|nr:gliding motility protein GldL [Flavobacteriales bacterium]